MTWPHEEEEDPLACLRPSPARDRMTRAILKRGRTAMYVDTIIRFRIELARRWRVLGSTLREEQHHVGRA